MKTMLVPLDGSPLAERAIPYAVAVARATDGRLAIVRTAHGLTRPGGDESQVRSKVMEEAEAYLEALAGRLAEHHLPIDTGTNGDDTVEGIILEADFRQADMIVMATHGRSGLGRWIYGSVAEAVLRRTTVPVMLIPAWLPEAGETPLGVKPKVLVPLDGSAFAEEALAPATTLAAALGGELMLVHAISPFEQVMTPEVTLPSYTEEAQAREEVARAYLNDLVKRSAASGVTVNVDIRMGLPPDAIAAAARENNATLVVMATHGRTGVRRLLMGSVADATLRRSELPILFVRPQQEKSGAAETAK